MCSAGNFLGDVLLLTYFVSTPGNASLLSTYRSPEGSSPTGIRYTRGPTRSTFLELHRTWFKAEGYDTLRDPSCALVVLAPLVYRTRPREQPAWVGGVLLRIIIKHSDVVRDVVRIFICKAHILHIFFHTFASNHRRNTGQPQNQPECASSLSSPHLQLPLALQPQSVSVPTSHNNAARNLVPRILVDRAKSVMLRRRNSLTSTDSVV